MLPGEVCDTIEKSTHGNKVQTFCCGFVQTGTLTVHLLQKAGEPSVVISQTISWVSQMRLSSKVGISLFIESRHLEVVLTIQVKVCHITLLPHQGALAVVAIFNISI